MAQRPATVLDPAKVALLRKALMVAPMTLDLTGLSMYPAIRPGDRSRVVAVDPARIRVGDVILVTRDDRIFAHRVVALPSGPEGAWIIKGDTLLWPDPPVQQKDILGQVIGVERGGRYLDLCAPGRRRFGALMARLSGPYAQNFVRAMMLRRRVLAKLASIPAWRARRRAQATRVTVRPATDEDLQGVAMLLGDQQALSTPMAAIDMDELRDMAGQMHTSARDAGATLWVAELDGFIAAHAVIGPLGPDARDVPGWWVMSVYVKMTARGCGLAERIVRAGIDDAQQHGIHELRYAAFETNRPSLSLAAKLGFEPDAGEAAERFCAFFGRRDPTGARLVVLKRVLEEPPR